MRASHTAFLALVVAMFLWGSSFVAFKYALEAFHPVVVVWARLLVASVLFFVFLPSSRRVRVARQDWLLLGLMVLCEPCLYFLLEGLALQWTTASQAGMVSAILPVLVALSSWWMGETPRVWAWVGLVLAMVGVGLVSWLAPASASAPYPLWGNLLELAAMVCAAGYTVCLKRLCRSYSPWFLTAAQTTGGMVFFSLAVASPWVHLPQRLPLGPSLAVLYLGLAISVGAYGLYNYGVSRLPAWQASAFINLIPIFALVLDWLFLGEAVGWLHVLGTVLVCGGVGLAQISGKAPGGP
jgi:drug/metabolite transporter (DMT)-like permease